QPGVVDDRRQDVVEFVSHARGEGAHAAEFLCLKQLLAELVCFGTGNHHVLTDHFGSPPDLPPSRSWSLGRPFRGGEPRAQGPSAISSACKGVSAPRAD